MKAYIYNTETNEVVATIDGESNEACEAKADDLGYMGVDEYGLSYNDNDLSETARTEHHDA